MQGWKDLLFYFFAVFVSGAGDDVGMDLLLSPEPNEYYSYTRSFYGIHVAIHAQEDYPDMSSSFIIQPGYHAKAFITPYVVSSDEAVCYCVYMYFDFFHWIYFQAIFIDHFRFVVCRYRRDNAYLMMRCAFHLALFSFQFLIHNLFFTEKIKRHSKVQFCCLLSWMPNGIYCEPMQMHSVLLSRIR